MDESFPTGPEDPEDGFGPESIELARRGGFTSKSHLVDLRPRHGSIGVRCVDPASSMEGQRMSYSRIT